MTQITPEFAKQTIAVMESNNAWFISELADLQRKEGEATWALLQHRKCMKHRETILSKLREMTQ